MNNVQNDTKTRSCFLRRWYQRYPERMQSYGASDLDAQLT